MIVIVEELLVLCAQGIAVDSPPHFLAVRGLEANSPTLPVYEVGCALILSNFKK
jgi:hypothetical protein